jgi:hypothetical protein
MDDAINKQHVPYFESVATTGIGVEEALKGITQLVLTHLVKKYGLEGSEPIDREIQILNPVSAERPKTDSLWDDEEPAAAAAAPAPSAPPAATTAPRVAVAAAPASSSSTPSSADDESIPLVETELVGSSSATIAMTSQSSPFEDVSDYFSTPGPASMEVTDVPMTSIEIPLPPGILDSLPALDNAPSAVAAPPAPERRSSDGLVKEVSIPLNLSVEELRHHRRLKLKITLDVNLLP